MFECNRLHGFLRMNHFADEKTVPCVRSKIYDDNTDISKIDNDLYTIKVVKEFAPPCESCKKADCDDCENLEWLYEDFSLPINKKVRKEEFEQWTNERLEDDANSIFYYYKYFESELHGKLIIGNNYYCIERINEDTNECVESLIIQEDDELFSATMENFSKVQIDDILRYAKKIKNTLECYFKCSYSIIMNFAFISSDYFLDDSFNDTKLLFYGMRTAYNKVDLDYIIA